MKVKDFVYEMFLRLTSKTCPYGFENEFVEDMKNIFPNLEKDQHGNFFINVGDSRTIFTSHIDTVSKDYKSVVHVIEGDIVKTDGNTTLGADDKAGVTIMLWMIRNNVPGLYYFFIGEEVGCVGSGLAAKYGDFKGKYDRVVSFDRRGTSSVITYQSSSRCCSDKFADDLCRQLNKSGMSYKKDDGGVYTDSAEFVDIIPECTNISVGYYSEHTFQERQDMTHLARLAEACVKVDWESLSVSRNPSVSDYKKYDNWSLYGDYSTSYSSKKNKRNRRSKSKGRYYDDWYDQNDSYGRSYNNNFTYWNTSTGLEEDFFSESTRQPKKYYSSGSDLIEISSEKSITGDKYDWILKKFSNSQMCPDELEFIKENYLDMNIDYDKFFYEYLKEIKN
jgi:hypothetical protein